MIDGLSRASGDPSARPSLARNARRCSSRAYGDGSIAGAPRLGWRSSRPAQAGIDRSLQPCGWRAFVCPARGGDRSITDILNSATLASVRRTPGSIERTDDRPTHLRRLSRARGDRSRTARRIIGTLSSVPHMWGSIGGTAWMAFRGNVPTPRVRGSICPVMAVRSTRLVRPVHAGIDRHFACEVECRVRP